MKSTQDVHNLLKQLAVALNKEVLSIETFTDKSFRIYDYDTEEPVLLYCSTEHAELCEIGDINDLPYTELSKLLEGITLIADLRRDYKDGQRERKILDGSELASQSRAA